MVQQAICCESCIACVRKTQLHRNINISGLFVLKQHANQNLPCLYRNKFVYDFIKVAFLCFFISIHIKARSQNLSCFNEAQRYERISFSFLKYCSQNEKYQVKIKLVKCNVVIFNKSM